MPELEPTNSPTTAPTTASVIETFSPEKIAGIACGRLTAQNTRKRLPCIARARSTMSGSTDLNPCTADTTTGKNPNRNKNGRTRAALSAFETAFGPFGSATSRSPDRFYSWEKLTRWINTVQWLPCDILGRFAPSFPDAQLRI